MTEAVCSWQPGRSTTVECEDHTGSHLTSQEPLCAMHRPRPRTRNRLVRHRCVYGWVCFSSCCGSCRSGCWRPRSRIAQRAQQPSISCRGHDGHRRRADHPRPARLLRRRNAGQVDRQGLHAEARPRGRSGRSSSTGKSEVRATSAMNRMGRHHLARTPSFAVADRDVRRRRGRAPARSGSETASTVSETRLATPSSPPRRQPSTGGLAEGPSRTEILPTGRSISWPPE